MKKLFGSLLLGTALVFSLSLAVRAGDSFVEEPAVDCECNSSNQCVAEGGGGDCHNGSKCWKSDLNCRGTQPPTQQ